MCGIVLLYTVLQAKDNFFINFVVANGSDILMIKENLNFYFRVMRLDFRSFRKRDRERKRSNKQKKRLLKREGGLRRQKDRPS